MSQERSSDGGEKRPKEVIGFTEEEKLKWRVDQERAEGQFRKQGPRSSGAAPMGGCRARRPRS